MSTFTKIAIVVCAMAGAAAADSHMDKKAAPKDAKAPTDPKAAPKDAKAGDPKAGDPKAAPAKVEAPKPAAEIDAMAKTVVGTWKCKGDGFKPDGTKAPITATNTTKVDLDKFWIVDNLNVKMAPGFKMMSYTTYDAASKKWRRVSVDNWGSQMVGTSDGMKDNKMTWNMDTTGGQMGGGQFRDNVDASDAKAGVKFWGESSMDKGKTWNKVYEMTCKK